MSTRSILCIGLMVSFGFVNLPQAAAQTPLGTAFTYQGQLNDGGSPANGLHDLRFRLYDAAAGGALVGTVLCTDDMSVTDGLFTVSLDFGAQFAGQERFLEIEVRADTGLDCTNPAGFVLLSPRQPLSAAPNALYASNADQLDGLDSTAFLQSISVPLTLIGQSGSHIIRGENTSTSPGSYGVLGESDSTTGNGVYGHASAFTGEAYGVVGRSQSTSGRGVYGQAYASGAATYGVYGLSFSGTGVYGAANATTGNTYGVHGRTNASGGRGVFGEATSASGGNYGVFGESASTVGRGVNGLAASVTGSVYGVFGQTPSESGRGVFGWATAGTGTIYGVYGQASTAAAGYAVFAAGDMGASGVKPFRIDHPDDPANKYLLHYSTESPEVLNIYSGKVILDASGEAVVELPHYFAKINTDPRYTLTAVGAPMPMLHVAQEIDETALSAGADAGPDEAAPLCSFRIAGGAPGAKLSWEVKAVRNDRWVQQRGAPVEVEKQGLEKGTDQHPQLYGQPAERGMNYRLESERPSAALSNPIETISSGASTPK